MTWELVRTADNLPIVETHSKKELTAWIAAGNVKRSAFLAYGREDYEIRKVSFRADRCDGCTDADEDWAVAHGECSQCGRPISRDFFRVTD